MLTQIAIKSFWNWYCFDQSTVTMKQQLKRAIINGSTTTDTNFSLLMTNLTVTTNNLFDIYFIAFCFCFFFFSCFCPPKPIFFFRLFFHFYLIINFCSNQKKKKGFFYYTTFFLYTVFIYLNIWLLQKKSRG